MEPGEAADETFIRAPEEENIYLVVGYSGTPVPVVDEYE